MTFWSELNLMIRRAPLTCLSGVLDRLFALAGLYLSLRVPLEIMGALRRHDGAFALKILGFYGLFLSAKTVCSRLLACGAHGQSLALGLELRREVMRQGAALSLERQARGEVLDDLQFALDRRPSLPEACFSVLLSAFGCGAGLWIAGGFVTPGGWPLWLWLGFFTVLQALTALRHAGLATDFDRRRSGSTRRMNQLLHVMISPHFARALRTPLFCQFLFSKRRDEEEGYMALFRAPHRPLRDLEFAQSFSAQAEGGGLALWMLARLWQGAVTVEVFFVTLSAYRQLKNTLSGVLELAVQARRLGRRFRLIAPLLTDLSEERRPLDRLEEVRFDRVTFTYPGGETPVRDLSFRVRRGDKLCLTGPNGCGKSTVLALACGLRLPTSGAVYYNGSPEYGSGRFSPLGRMGCAFADDELYPCRVDQFVSGRIGADGIGLPEGIDDPALRDVLTGSTALTGQADANGIDPSGGQARLLYLLRAFSEASPDGWLVLDEPFAHLDEERRARLARLLTRWPGTVLLVSHHGVPDGFTELALKESRPC